MKATINELVERLMVSQEVEFSRPEKTSKALIECIKKKYVHVLFKKTGTELGFKLNPKYCNYTDADFENLTGKVVLVGALTLNYDKVTCNAVINLDNCEGTGFLKLVDDEEYDRILE